VPDARQAPGGLLDQVAQSLNVHPARHYRILAEAGPRGAR
jgi:hypothetical protein